METIAEVKENITKALLKTGTSIRIGEKFKHEQGSEALSLVQKLNRKFGDGRRAPLCLQDNTIKFSEYFFASYS